MRTHGVLMMDPAGFLTEPFFVVRDDGTRGYVEWQVVAKWARRSRIAYDSPETKAKLEARLEQLRHPSVDSPMTDVYGAPPVRR